ncbi:hypothetical protein TNIN_407811 [Trichonephila inaurata madagascariensis]|uniref:Uncharacterized protein n=1 Tax=Trichonephila inaurata madagascariensis TaxID=2747483 RepID=A0A8X7CQQ0_9ARAC|nr:hypothetical protein TNIN_407811 [Trichonephila inaurata madagascariensis]
MTKPVIRRCGVEHENFRKQLHYVQQPFCNNQCKWWYVRACIEMRYSLSKQGEMAREICRRWQAIYGALCFKPSTLKMESVQFGGADKVTSSWAKTQSRCQNNL